ncbi:zinc finger MYM-type protein 1-like [Hydra vulgaris]|uniref:Zinc finger MYM-type protein 1-like n=1 Tax=Hydra vulgaris TaxID=6087 RepID=A0ABM4BG65_HYDVU
MEVVIRLVETERIAGESIALSIKNALEEESINIKDCKGQAYDSTASMSSDRKWVQTFFKKWALYADYQGCVLHYLNLTICYGCEISSIRNMMDSCQQLFSFSDNLPKRQRFIHRVISTQAPELKKTKLKNLCKTRWLERHSTFNTVDELYIYIIHTLDETVTPSDDIDLYDDLEPKSWNWDSETRSKANGWTHIY